MNWNTLTLEWRSTESETQREARVRRGEKGWSRGEEERERERARLRLYQLHQADGDIRCLGSPAGLKGHVWKQEDGATSAAPPLTLTRRRRRPLLKQWWWWWGGVGGGRRVRPTEE